MIKILNINTGINWPHIKRRLIFEFRRIESQGIRHISLKIISKSSSVVLWFFLLPITMLLHFAGFRRVPVFTDRIGHLALEPDCLMKEQALGHIPKHKWIILAPPGRVANEHLLSYWEPHFIIIRQPTLCYLINSMSIWLLMRYDISHYILAVGKAHAAYRIYAEWGDRAPMLKLSLEDERWAKTKLKELGLPEGAWFVCVHVREGGFSPVDEELHSHRNGSIENTIPAIQEITRRGGWVVRIGDPTMSPLMPTPQVIDYAHHPFKSNRLDIVLCSKARFILGNTSGIALVGTVFAVPCAIANSIPISTLWFLSKDISIPKLIWCRSKARYLRLDEILTSEIANFQYPSLYEHNGLEVIENSADDIFLLTQEMLNDIEYQFNKEMKPNMLYSDVRNLFNSDNFGFGSIASISTTFLKYHPELLP